MDGLEDDRKVSVRSGVNTINKLFIAFVVISRVFFNSIVIGECDEVFERSCQLAKEVKADLLRAYFERFDGATCHGATAVQTLNEDFSLVTNHP